MSGTRILPALLALVLSLCLASDAEARKWRWWFSWGHGHVARSGDDGGRRARAAAWGEAGRGSRNGQAFGAVVDRLVRGCLQQADDLRNWPFGEIARIAAPDDAQRLTLEALRASVAAAVERLSTDCPQDVPAAPRERLAAVEQAIDAATSTFAAVEPLLQGFYAALDDEQKARLLRDLTLSPAQARDGDRRAERRERRSYRERRAYAPESNRASNSVCSPPPCGEGLGVGVARSTQQRARPSGPNPWTAICEDLTAALRGWPVREIERGVRLSEPQRVAFYELVTSSLKAADALATACPAETALTPPGRMTLMRARLAAVRAAAAAVRPALVEFYDALDHGQKVRFAGMS